MSYDPSLTTQRDRLRFQLGDIDPDAELLPDETYDAVLAQYANDERQSTITLATSLINRYAQMPNKVVTAGGSDVTWTNRVAGWQELIKRLRAETERDQAVAASGLRTLRPRRAGSSERAEYRRDLGDYEW